MNAGMFGYPVPLPASLVALRGALREYTVPLLYSALPGTRNLRISPRIGDIIVAAWSAGGSGASSINLLGVGGGAGGGFAMIAMPVRELQSISYTIGQGGAPISGSGSFNGTQGGSTLFGSMISITGGYGGILSDNGSASVAGGVPTVSGGTLIASANGGAATRPGAKSTYLGAAGGGASPGTWLGDGLASSAGTTPTGSVPTASGGNSPYAIAGTVSDGPTGGAGPTASTDMYGGYSPAVDLASTYGADLTLIELLMALGHGAGLGSADGGTPKTHTTSGDLSALTSVANAADYTGGAALRVTLSGSPSNSVVLTAGNGGRFGGGGAATLESSATSVGVTLLAGKGGMFAGGGAAAIYQSSGAAANAYAGDGGIAAGGGGVTSAAAASLSGRGGNGLIIVLGRPL